MSVSHSDHDKALALQDVFYEMEQLVFLFPLLSTPSLDATLVNVYLDAILIHIRALLDFYECSQDKSGKDDVLAEDYGFAAREINIDPSYRVRLNKDLAHITYSRIHRSPTTKGWNFLVLLPPILQRCYDFMSYMKDHYPPGTEDKFKENWSLLCDQVNVLKDKKFTQSTFSTRSSSEYKTSQWPGIQFPKR